MINPLTYISGRPIFLDQLSCSVTDTDLVSCRRGDTILGLASCSHSQDVWIECKGG